MVRDFELNNCSYSESEHIPGIYYNIDSPHGNPQYYHIDIDVYVCQYEESLVDESYLQYDKLWDKFFEFYEKLKYFKERLEMIDDYEVDYPGADGSEDSESIITNFIDGDLFFIDIRIKS